jgi:hypothetical protein
MKPANAGSKEGIVKKALLERSSCDGRLRNKKTCTGDRAGMGRAGIFGTASAARKCEEIACLAASWCRSMVPTARDCAGVPTPLPSAIAKTRLLVFGHANVQACSGRCAGGARKQGQYMVRRLGQAPKTSAIRDGFRPIN